MTDPKRLLDGAGSELERELLGVLARERPSPALTRRMRQGLVALGLLTSAKTGIAGIAAVVGLVSVGVTTAWVVQRERAEPRTLSTAGVTSAVVRAANGAVSRPPAPPSPPPASAPVPSLSPRSSTPPAAPSSAAGDLREQIALLDRARAAVRARDSGAALAELAAYGKRFPRGEFAQEVTVLKIEALVQNGQMEGARPLAKRFLAAHPESPHVERIERLMGASR